MAEKQSLRRSVFTNLIWRFLERCGAQIVSFIVSIVLARILLPEQYGTISLVMVFIVILNVFIDSGMGIALIQKKDADDLDFSSLFYFNLAMCTVLYCVMFFLAPVIARFYKIEQLTSVIRVLSLVLVISGVKNIQMAYISRQLLFKKFFFATLGGTVGAAVLGIYMAYRGCGVWSLVAQHLFNSFVDTVILWFSTNWRPRLMFSIARIKELFSFGWKLLVSALLDTGYRNMSQLVIGRMYSPQDLALYNRGEQFPQVIVQNINNSIDSVLLPVLSKKQGDRDSVKAMVRRSISMSVFLMAPLMLGLAAVADTVVSLLLTEKWMGCVFFLRIFCITYMFYPIHTANLNAINALGRSDIFLKLEIAKKVVGISVLLASMWFGVRVMACTALATNIIGMIINSYPNKKLLGYSFIEQMSDVFPSVISASVMGLTVFFLGCINVPQFPLLLLQIIFGAGMYIFISAVVRNESFVYLMGIARGRIKRKTHGERK